MNADTTLSAGMNDSGAIIIDRAAGVVSHALTR
ncbi:hypothetical protein GGQ82_001398 [Sphingobium olei]